MYYSSPSIDRPPPPPPETTSTMRPTGSQITASVHTAHAVLTFAPCHVLCGLQDFAVDRARALLKSIKTTDFINE